MSRIFITRELPGPALSALGETHEIVVWPERLPPSYEQLRKLASDADGLISLITDRVDADLIAACPRLRVISNYAVGFDNIDLDAAAARNIPVGHTPDVLTDATADLAFALLFAVARRIPEATTAVRAGQWKTWEPGGLLGAEVHGATLGVIGHGRIGQAVAQRAAGFGMKVLITKKHTAEELDDVLAQSDFASIHLPLTAETHRLIGARAFALMKPTAILINTARGAIVDQTALAAALHGGQIAGAALDVTDPEPLPDGDPLLDAPNLVVVPHIGSATRVARERMTRIAVANLVAGLAGEPLPHQVPASATP